MLDATVAQFEVVTGGGVARVTVVGEVDLANASTFQSHVAQALGAPAVSSVVIDLDRCSYLDSIGVRVLFDGAARAGESGRRVAIVGANGVVRRVLDIVGADSVVDVVG